MAQDRSTGREIAADLAKDLASGVVAVLAVGTPAIWPVVFPVIAGLAARDVIQRLLRDRADRAERFVQTSEDLSGRDFDDLLIAAAESPEVRQLFERAAAAATETRDEWTIDNLAAMFVSAVDRPERVDQHMLIVDALRQLQPPHARVLRVLAGPSPLKPAQPPTHAAPVTGSESQHLWPISAIVDADPGVEPALDAVLANLQSLGLVIKQADEPMFELTRFGRACTNSLARRSQGEADLAEPDVEPARPGTEIFRLVDTTTVIADGGIRIADVRNALVQYLRDLHQLSAWAAEKAARTIRLERMWWGDSVGFAHDCAGHGQEEAGPHCYTFRLVTAAIGLPEQQSVTAGP